MQIEPSKRWETLRYVVIKLQFKSLMEGERNATKDLKEKMYATTVEIRDTGK
jgi:hypothetical protein